jgi:c-di-GMP-binding flagellar brake protein YcgR
MPGVSKLSRSPRYQIVLPLSYRTVSKGATAAQDGSGRTRNLSVTGGCIELTGGLAPGALLSVVLQDEAETLDLNAEVVWVGHPPLPSGETMHGVRFLQVPQQQRETLGDLIRRRGRLRSGATRIPAALPIECHPPGAAGESVRGWTGDLSWEGCLLLLPDRFPVGTLIEVTLTTPRGDVTAKATVVWVEPRERDLTRQLTRHGVRFAAVTWTRDSALNVILDRIPTAVGQEPSAG